MFFVIYLSFNFYQRSLAMVSLITTYFWSFIRQSLIIPQAKVFTFCHSSSVMSSDLSFSNAICKFCWNNTSIISHRHIPKLAPSNFSTSNLTFITIDHNDVEDFEDCPSVSLNAYKPKAQSPGFVFRKYLTFMNLQ